MSEVSICNMALSHIGDPGQVTSIRPPDGSVQAQYCANLYAPARDALLEMHPWGFATMRVALAQVTNPTINTWTNSDGSTSTNCGAWQFAYALPSAVLNVLAVIPAWADADYQQRLSQYGPSFSDGLVPWPDWGTWNPDDRFNVPQPYVLETLATGEQIVLTNVCNAILRFTTAVTDTTQFSPLFTVALSYLLASMLAGPIIKGDAGIQVAEQQLQLFVSFKNQAIMSDANQRKVNVQASPTWMKGR